MNYNEFLKLTKSQQSYAIKSIDGWQLVMMSYLNNYTSKSSDSYDSPLNNTLKGYRVVPESITDVEVISATEDTSDSKGIITFKITVTLGNSGTDYYLKLKSNQVFPTFKVGSLFGKWNISAVESTLKELNDALEVRKSLEGKVTDVDMSNIKVPTDWKSTPIDELRALSGYNKAELFKLSYPGDKWKSFILSYWSSITECDPTEPSYRQSEFIPQCYLNEMNSRYGDKDVLLEIDLTPLNFGTKDIVDLKSLRFMTEGEDKNKAEYAIFKFSTKFVSFMYLKLRLNDVVPEPQYGDNKDKLDLIKNVISVLNDKAKEIDNSFRLEDALNN